MAADLLTLSTRDESGAFRVVVESPRGAAVKLKYSPELGAFCLSRPLVVGLTYPFDWGFVPGTRGPDGDPLDAMLLFDAALYPGVVVSCRALAVLQIEQNVKNGPGRQRNDRIIAEPVESRRPAPALSSRVRDELVAFFMSATLFEKKDVRVLGWGDAAAADALIDGGSERK